MEERINKAKEGLKDTLIDTYGKTYYYQLIGEKSRWLNSIKENGDKVFGRNDKEFREQVHLSTLEKNKDNSESEQLYELCIVDLALDLLIEEF